MCYKSKFPTEVGAEERGGSVEWENRKRAEIVREKLPDHNRNFLSLSPLAARKYRGGLKCGRGLENCVPAVAYHFWLNLPEQFSQPRDHSSALHCKWCAAVAAEAALAAVN